MEHFAVFCKCYATALHTRSFPILSSKVSIIFRLMPRWKVSIALPVLFYFVSWLFWVLSFNWRVAEPIPSKKWESTRKEATALHSHTESEQNSGGPAPAAIQTASRTLSRFPATRDASGPHVPTPGLLKTENQPVESTRFSGPQSLPGRDFFPVT